MSSLENRGEPSDESFAIKYGLYKAKDEIAVRRRLNMDYSLVAVYTKHVLDRVIVASDAKRLIAIYVTLEELKGDSIWVSNGKSASSFLWWLMKSRERYETKLVKRLSQGDIGALRVSFSGTYPIGPYPN